MSFPFPDTSDNLAVPLLSTNDVPARHPFEPILERPLSPIAIPSATLGWNLIENESNFTPLWPTDPLNWSSIENFDEPPIVNPSPLPISSMPEIGSTSVESSVEEARTLDFWGATPYSVADTTFQSTLTYPDVYETFLSGRPFYTRASTIFSISGPKPFSIVLGGVAIDSYHDIENGSHLIQFPDGLPVFMLKSKQCLVYCGDDTSLMEMVGEVYGPMTPKFPPSVYVACTTPTIGDLMFYDGVLTWEHVTVPETRDLTNDSEVSDSEVSDSEEASEISDSEEASEQDDDLVNFFANITMSSYMNLTDEKQDDVYHFLDSHKHTTQWSLNVDMTEMRAHMRELETWLTATSATGEERLDQLGDLQTKIMTCMDSMHRALRATHP